MNGHIERTTGPCLSRPFSDDASHSALTAATAGLRTGPTGCNPAAWFGGAGCCCPASSEAPAFRDDALGEVMSVAKGGGVDREHVSALAETASLRGDQLS
jgi:hypothetical protein